MAKTPITFSSTLGKYVDFGEYSRDSNYDDDDDEWTIDTQVKTPDCQGTKVSMTNIYDGNKISVCSTEGSKPVVTITPPESYSGKRFRSAMDYYDHPLSLGAKKMANSRTTVAGACLSSGFGFPTFGTAIAPPFTSAFSPFSTVVPQYATSVVPQYATPSVAVAPPSQPAVTQIFSSPPPVSYSAPPPSQPAIMQFFQSAPPTPEVVSAPPQPAITQLFTSAPPQPTMTSATQWTTSKC